MIKIHDNYYCPFYEYLYLFVMVVYMAQMTPDTARMVGTLSGNSVPFLIPIVMTIVLLFRHPVSFAHRRLWLFSSIMLCWSIAVCYKFHDFSNSNLSYYFFLFYAIFIAYIHIRVYGCDLFPIYEHIMVVFSLISLALWGICILIPFTSDFFQSFPETLDGNNVLYLFHWLDPLKAPIESVFRNSGCSWEPGRFAIMLIPAILINLSRKGISFHNNKNIIILLLALASTMSTTGYSIAILLYAIYWFEKFTVKKSIYFAVLILPLFWYLFTLDFMTEKIQDRADFKGLTNQSLAEYVYHAEKSGDETLGALDRFESAYFDWLNFLEDPLLGYGRNGDHSWFRQEITRNFELTGGLVKTFSQFGAFIGLLLYVILFFSSIKISKTFVHQRKLALALALLLCSISYPVFTVPIFTVFWLYGLFYYKEDNHRKRILIGVINSDDRVCFQ